MAWLALRAEIEVEMRGHAEAERGIESVFASEVTPKAKARRVTKERERKLETSGDVKALREYQARCRAWKKRKAAA